MCKLVLGISPMICITKPSKYTIIRCSRHKVRIIGYPRCCYYRIKYKFLFVIPKSTLSNNVNPTRDRLQVCTIRKPWAYQLLRLQYYSKLSPFSKSRVITINKFSRHSQSIPKKASMRLVFWILDNE
jgi:hypothetical protein